MAYQNLNHNQRISRGKIKLTRERPFFGSLVYYLNPVAANEKIKESLEGRTHLGGVTEKGSLLYFPEAVEELPEDQLMTFLAHEALHCGFNHFKRQGERDDKLWNIALDVAVNNILEMNGFTEIEGSIWPEDNEFYCIIGNDSVKIEDLDEKSAEQIYDILMNKAEEQARKGNMEYDEDGIEIDIEGHDVHMDEEEANDIDENDEMPDIQDGVEDRDDEFFDRKMSEAKQEASQTRGNQPAGMGLKMDQKKKASIDWRAVLHQNMTSAISSDYTFSQPNMNYYNMKKEDNEGNMRRLYLPSEENTGLDVVLSIDTSGSIGQEELEKFVGEVYAIASSFDAIEMKVIQHDSKVQKVDEVNTPRELEDLTYKGGGGTSHPPVVERMEKDNDRNRLYIGFTDGYTRWPDQKRFNRLGINPIWVIDNYSVEPPYGKVLRNGKT